ncbi:uncharacterized protein BN793_00170 [Firmicutes bacterium CAG:822]|nr:uncharacterized protein BN793_00170 [Firmicutes bacterium CAG:822]
MLGKVLKYDLKALCRYLIPLYAVLFGLGIMIRLLGFFDNVSIIAIICGLMIVALVVLSCLSFVLNGIFSVKYYLENLFKDEGYLTHTLPVKKGTLLFSKVLASLVTFSMTALVLIISLIVAFYQKGLFVDVVKVLNLSIYGMTVYEFLLFMIVYGIIGYVATILMVYAAIAIGYSRSSNKLVSSVVWGLIFYFVMEFLYLGLLGIIMIINPTFISNLDNSVFMMKDLITFFSIFMVFTALIGGVYYYISYRFMDKKLNLE